SHTITPNTITAATITTVTCNHPHSITVATTISNLQPTKTTTTIELTILCFDPFKSWLKSTLLVGIIALVCDAGLWQW
ncbi:Hypothetical predicted protein, partial [Olea europaea subsp. europaea]